MGYFPAGMGLKLCKPPGKQCFIPIPTFSINNAFDMLYAICYYPPKKSPAGKIYAIPGKYVKSGNAKKGNTTVKYKKGVLFFKFNFTVFRFFIIY